ncbi:MAG: hypothetical protein KAH44_07930, partial [Oricola sp.]|nr:hypothetical protein [Oricola sp.]
MIRRIALVFLLFAASIGSSSAAERPLVDRLLQLAKSQPGSDAFRTELVAALGGERIEKGNAIIGHGPDFIWAVESEKRPVLYVDDEKYAEMKKASGNLWFYAGKLATGEVHKFHYMVADEVMGGSLNIAAYTPDSYAQPGVPQGELSEKMVYVSKKIYPGMETSYWVYAPAQYDPSKPAALMIWQDGNRLIGRPGEELWDGGDNEDSCILCPSLVRIFEVTDNLTHRKEIPVMIHLFVQPGTL